jgi:hypothetical protein
VAALNRTVLTPTASPSPAPTTAGSTLAPHAQ